MNRDLRTEVKQAARQKRIGGTEGISVSRAQVELSAEIVRMLPEETAARIATEHFGDDRHHHIALFTDKEGATRFMNACLDALPLETDTDG